MSKAPHGDILIKHGTPAEYAWPCRRCQRPFTPKFYNPNNKRGFGKFPQCCGTCSMTNLLEFVFAEDGK